MKRLRLSGEKLMLAVGLTLAAGPVLAAEVEAKKDGVEVYADATNKSDVLGKLKEGESLTAGERKGMFWQVTTKDGKTGFVSVLAVKHKAEANDDLAKAIKSVVKEGREGEGNNNDARARSAVMGVRGLRADDDMANASNVRPNLRAVYKMEDVKQSNKKVQKLGDDVFNEIAKKSGGN
jgi:uncharacterized protein YgiM (DUF1202 family)